MRQYGGQLLLSAGDLVTFLGCRHASALDYRALTEPLEAGEDDPTLVLLQKKGIEHERAHLASLEAAHRTVARIPDRPDLDQRIRLTMEAMRSGAEIVYQAALRNGQWHGFADFLHRVDLPSDLGAWSYEASDTKLASDVSPRYVAQLSVYSDLLKSAQGAEPHHMSVVLGDGRTEVLRTEDFAPYMRLAAQRLEAFLKSDEVHDTTPEPCAHCANCSWQERCNAEWEEADHLSLVANMRTSQADKLRAAGITTVVALAKLSPKHRVPDMLPETLAKLRDQARLQVAVRGTDRHEYQLLELEAGRGFARLPKPASGDLFFDMEGDPLYPDGLEYLFGIHDGDPKRGKFRAFWAHDRNEERRALEAFIDFVGDHLARHPDAHIYHYGHYEVSAVRRLAMAHGTCEAVVDDLLRRHKFVDLLKVVRESILISEPRYSLKNVEKFYLGPRQGDVATAGDSIVAYEAWRVTGEPKILQDIESYNALDCRSTAALRDWLLSIRPPRTPWFDPDAVGPDEDALKRQREAEAERQAIEAALLGGVPEEEKPFRKLVVDLVQFHRREQKPEWWATFDRQDRDEEELIDDPDCLGGLRLVGPPVPEKRSLVHTYHFPAQETKLGVGDRPVIVHTVEPAGSIEQLDMEAGLIKLKRGTNKGPLPPTLSLGPAGPLDDKVLRAAIARFAASVAQGTGQFPALERLLKREPPRLSGRKAGAPIVAPGADLIAASIAAVAALDRSHLFIQGPPGTGKTYTASHVIVELLKRGERVGVSSHSHKAINNLLAGVEKAASASKLRFKGYKKSDAQKPETCLDGGIIRDVFTNDDVPVDADLMAGTAWLFARDDFEGVLDYLFVDEAGQVSLANLVAMGTAAQNIVLVGDQMQLGQPIHGSHPGESGLSALEHLLHGTPTVPPDRGIFLDVTWRMHPELCGWVSKAIYEDRLMSHPSLSQQALILNGRTHPALKPHGLCFVSVDHEGRSQGAPEEAEEVKAIWTNLIGQRWRDRGGQEHRIAPQDVLVVAPYNVQVNTIAALLPDKARVGTVDKFQGQEAAVVIVSMTSSSGEDIPRGIDFLFSRNRLNVAISRARCLSVVLASPRLLEVPCSTVENLKLVSTLCSAYEWSMGLA